MFELPKYRKPDFNNKKFKSAPNVRVANVKKEGVAPENYHITSMYPEYFKVNGEWMLTKNSRMDCAPVIVGESRIETKEFRNLSIGDKVIIGRTEDGSEGIYLHANGFVKEVGEKDVFAFRSGRSRETAFSKDYEDLFELLKHEKENGNIVWVLGPAVSFDYKSRRAMSALIENGYAHAVLAGNALATHDLEGALFHTALGQDIRDQDSKHNGHYHHLDAINKARNAGSIEKFIENEDIQEGIVYSCVKNNVPLVLAGSIRDDGPLPSVFANVYDAQDAMRNHAKRATTLICLATQLHTIAAGNMTPSYTIVDEEIRPVFIYAVDVSEFVLNKLRDRGTLEVTTIVANIQDFLGKLSDHLID
ncbi:putative NPN-dependent ornithine cyclodeaminase [Marinisporobacter balticus]|uniref:Lysine-ketoglutarate reductase/saccharopine dehydrogenase-like protein (TIGR00300 family) n=1 Tax=Marinisporobacter balticus TaxID=2018667 RepID=A0A4R2KZX9_9FIRM|nr:lysine-ketoglutarate reductase/saccharopine dehydrogenase-like protein (TIGR00300 family) [Marinisporobacter balticus]